MGLVYYIIKPLVKGLLPVYYKKITVDNSAVVPKSGPVLIASNHPNSFMDAFLMGVFMNRTANFLVRGDVFKYPVVRFILEQTNQIPIYRKRDGYTNVKQNDRTFEICYDKFEKNELITIYSEGLCITEKRLRTIQKGTSRMAFGLYDERGLDNLVIVPHGINYFEGTKSGTTVMTSFGQPIYVKDYLELYKEEPAKAIKKLTEDIEAQLKKLVIHIEDPQYDETVDRLLMVLENTYPDPVWPVEFNNNRLQRELNFVDQFNRKVEQEKIELNQKATAYYTEMSKSGVADVVVSDATRGNFFLQLVNIIVWFLPFLLVAITHGWMYLVTRKIVNEKIKLNEFKTSIRFTIPFVIILVVAVVLFLLLFFNFTLFLCLLIYWLVAPVLVFTYPRMFKKLMYQIKWMNTKSAQRDKLQVLRDQLMEGFDL